MAIRHSADSDTRLLSAVLSNQSQQQILSLLAEESRPTTDRDLAVHLVSGEDNISLTEVSEAEVRQRLVALHHAYLPMLEAIGWIDRLPEGIVTTDQFPFGDPESEFPQILDSETQWDILSCLLARPRRQQIVTILARQSQSLSLDELATEVKSHEQISWTVDEGEQGISLSGFLHHVDLPRLEEVGVLDYDPVDKMIVPKPVSHAVWDLIDGDGIGVEGYDEKSQS